MDQHKSIINKTQKKFTKKENRFYRMIIILNIIFVIARTAGMISTYIATYAISNNFQLKNLGVVNLFRQMSLMLMFSANAFSCLIYVPHDSNLRELISNFLGFKKV